MVIGKAGIWAADARRVERDRLKAGQVGQQVVPQPYLAPDAGVRQQRLTLPQIWACT
jgi:hypothetical protein